MKSCETSHLLGVLFKPDIRRPLKVPPENNSHEGRGSQPALINWLLQPFLIGSEEQEAVSWLREALQGAPVSSPEVRLPPVCQSAPPKWAK